MSIVKDAGLDVSIWYDKNGYKSRDSRTSSDNHKSDSDAATRGQGFKSMEDRLAEMNTGYRKLKVILE